MSADGSDDGTLRKHAERRIALLSAFAQGIVCEVDREGRYRDVWATDERLLAMPVQDLIGRTVVEALGEEVGRPLMQGTARVYATGVSETFEYTLALEAGLRAFEARIVRIPNEEGPEPSIVVALIRDVTVEKEMERKLQEAERLAALGVLAAGIGHEINNPLMIVQQNTRTLTEGLRALSRDLAPDAFAARVTSMLDMLGDVLAAVSRMQKNVADLRMFRRDETPSVAPVDPRAAVVQAIELALGQIQQRAVLERDLQAAPSVAIDAGKLGQVVLNLLLNATQAIPPTSDRAPVIRITTRTDERGWAVIEVADNGPGIPTEELARIFDPFFTTKREGMGLGLSVCQRIVTDHGGTIVAESELGHGATFRVSLPPTAEPSPIARAPSAEEARLPSLRFLVIDDDPALLRVLSATLREEHEVVVADGCDSALAILATDQRFDSILCDLMMPLGGGMSLYRQLENIAPTLQPRVIFMTGGAFTPESRRFLDSIPNPTIGKPFTLEALHSIVSAMLHPK